MLNNQHYCIYYIIRGVAKDHGYVERCKCGRMNVVSISRRLLEKKVEAIVSKQWFDREGNLERTTGNDVILPCNITKTIDTK